jgi:hypothetical protein
MIYERELIFVREVDRGYIHQEIEGQLRLVAQEARDAGDGAALNAYEGDPAPLVHLDDGVAESVFHLGGYLLER